MIFFQVNGEQVPHVVAYYNGGIDASKMSDAVKINPVEEYWGDVFGFRGPDADPSHYEPDSEMYQYLTNYWVTKELWDQVVNKCSEIGIPEVHCANLAVPLSDYPYRTRLPLDQATKERSIDATRLRDFCEELENNPLLHLSKLSFEYADGPRYNENTKKFFTKKIGKRTFTDYRVLLNLLMGFRNYLKEEPSFRNSIMNSVFLDHLDFDYRRTVTVNRHSYLHHIARYLLISTACSNASEARRKAGMLLSIHGYVLTREEFMNPTNEDLHASYGSYENYVQKLVDDRHNTLNNSRKGRVRK